MQRITPPSTRREFLGQLATLATAATVAPRFAAASAGPMLTRPTPATGEQVPVIGSGSWITLNVGDDQDLRDQRVQVLQSFFDRGGAVIDSSPMYGSSEEVIGYGLARLGSADPVLGD
ncbi:MAG: aldo/keto reductase [Geminicoccaceae bacterium]|nr:aldo/keto reductase [Geminicoccaceae bacterium]